MLASGDAGVDAAGNDVMVPSPCSTNGEGALRVTVSLDPSIDRGRADVWLSTHCGTNPMPIQVLRWDGTSAQTLPGLGPGTWDVYASSFVSPGAASPAVMLLGVATASVTVTLPSGAPLLARYDSASTVGPDGGVAEDAGVAAAWRGVAAISDPIEGTVGYLECYASPAGEGTLTVQVVVRNACTAAQCPTMNLVAAEARSLEGGNPMDLGTGSWPDGGVTVQPGTGAALPDPITLRGVLPGGSYTLDIAVFGTRGGMRLSGGA